MEIKQTANKIAAYFTEATGGKVDFFNSARKFRERMNGSFSGLIDLWNHYSWNEITTLSVMWGSAIVAAYWAANTCGDNQECSPMLRGMSAAVTTLTVEHLITVAPKVLRRNAKTKENHELYSKIIAQVENLHSEHQRDDVLAEHLITIKDKIQLCFETKVPFNRKGDCDVYIIKTKLMLEYFEAEISGMIHAIAENTTSKDELISASNEFWQRDRNSFIEAASTQMLAERTAPGF